ncbi:MAG: hypothetical protein EOO52_13690 [Gammaproteobacteria bacterium]|nr:MAG: hypothetical protein EOO52_13690 [Gammaproteobacteria bacterium]
MKRIFLCVLLIAYSCTIQANSFNNSVFYKVAVAKDVDPLLLYAIAYICSATQNGNEDFAPNPLALVIDGKRLNPTSLEKATRKLDEARYRTENINVGLMAISLKFFPRAYPDDLFDPVTNLEQGADILKELLRKNSDPVLAVGQYFSPVDMLRAKNYGERVWALRNSLEEYFKRLDAI